MDAHTDRPAQRVWEQALIDAYYDYRWRKLLSPLGEKFQQWRSGQLAHVELDNAIHRYARQTPELYELFSHEPGLLLQTIQRDRRFFEAWLRKNPPPPGVDLHRPADLSTPLHSFEDDDPA